MVDPGPICSGSDRISGREPLLQLRLGRRRVTLVFRVDDVAVLVNLESVVRLIKRFE